MYVGGLEGELDVYCGIVDLVVVEVVIDDGM